MKNLHETAIVSKLAKINETVKIGPYCIIGDYVVLKKNVNLIANVIIDGKTTIDENTVVVDAAQTQLIKDLERCGITAIPLTLRHARTLGGSFHCVTLDLIRE